jgi:hypothetical protein
MKDKGDLVDTLQPSDLVDNSSGSLASVKPKQVSRPYGDASSIQVAQSNTNEFQSDPLPAIDRIKGISRKYTCIVLGVSLVITFAVLLGAVFKLHRDNQIIASQLMEAKINPQLLVKQQTDAIIASVSRIMELPVNEPPTVADVTDAASAKSQSPFFNLAANGDKVLMFPKKGQAILYRPRTNKIILIAPLTNTQQTASGTTSPTN